jgi:thioesterase domain-containing protein
MPETFHISKYLTDFFAESLPVTDYLGMRVHEYDSHAFSLSIDLQPSINDKLTAFGGSLYNVCVMNCWGMVYLQARERGINPNIVVSKGEIEYLRPVKDELIVANCFSADVDWDAYYRSVGTESNPKVRLSSVVMSNGREAVRFNGEYAVIGLKE